MTATSLATSRMVSGQTDAWVTPRIAPGTLRPVIYCHGAGGSAAELLGSGVPAVEPLFDAIGDAGWPCVCVTITVLWGNVTCVSRMDAAIAYCRSTLGAHSTAKPLIVGISHGAACGLTYAYNRAVRGFVGISPAIDLQAIRVADTLGQRASIDAAWGVTYPAALPAGADPATHTSDLRSLPQQLWYASDDAVSANIGVYATAVGAELHNVGALGHTNAAVAAATPSVIVSWLGQFM